MSLENTTVIIGDEFDQDLRSKVLSLLRGMNAAIVNQDWGTAGSQEVDTIEFKLNDRSLYLESETYMGLSLRGHGEDIKKLMDEIAQ